jgi:hypothetical protein
VYPAPKANCTLKDAHELLSSSLEGFASFMAGQVVADLKNTKGHPLSKAEDWWTFSAPGPGSLRGLKWYFDREWKINHATYEDAMANVMYEIQDDLPYKICMQDLQNCMCEFDKYMRVKTGKGRSKRSYNGAG